MRSSLSPSEKQAYLLLAMKAVDSQAQGSLAVNKPTESTASTRCIVERGGKGDGCRYASAHVAVSNEVPGLRPRNLATSVNRPNGTQVPYTAKDFRHMPAQVQTPHSALTESCIQPPSSLMGGPQVSWATLHRTDFVCVEIRTGPGNGLSPSGQ